MNSPVLSLLHQAESEADYQAMISSLLEMGPSALDLEVPVHLYTCSHVYTPVRTCIRHIFTPAGEESGCRGRWHPGSHGPVPGHDQVGRRRKLGLS